MRVAGRHAVPLAAGLAAAATAFAVVALTSGSAPQEAAFAPLHPGRAVFVRMGCGSCHRLAAAGSEGQLGPDLDARLPHHTRESLAAQVLSPGGTGFGMPTDFGERMSEAELDALVGFLLAARGPR